MRCPVLIIALPLLAGLLACTRAHDGPGTQSVQPDGASTPPDPGITDKPPIHRPLAQYPSAPHEDRHGNLWFATAFEGLIRHDGNAFVTFTPADGLAGDTVRDILEDDDGILWIATTGGLSRYDGESFTTLTDYRDTPVTYSFTQGGDHRDIWDVLKDRHGTLWIATVAGVFRYDGTSFAPFPLPVLGTAQSFEFGPKMVYCIFEDKDGVLWFGTDGAGVVRYDGTGMVVYTAKDDGLCSDRVCAILQDRRGDFWFGTSDGGVSRYDGSSFTTHLRSKTFSEHFGWGRFMAIFEDRSGDVWFGVASTGGGAYRYDGETFRYLSQREGLGIGGVPSIGEDRGGNVWLGTTTGVFRFDGERFVHFTKSD